MCRRLASLLLGLQLAWVCFVLPGAHAQRPATATVRRAAENELVNHFPESGSSTKVRVRRLRGEIDSTARIRVNFAERRGPPRGLARADIEVRTTSGSWKVAGWALLYVAHYDSVMTTSTRVRAGEKLSAENVEATWIETTDFRGSPITTEMYRNRLDEGVLVAARLVQAGRPLRGSDVRRPHAAETGSPIDVHYWRGRFSLRLSCKAREPGFTEEIIRVYCPDTQTTYRARIVTASAARWVETL